MADGEISDAEKIKIASVDVANLQLVHSKQIGASSHDNVNNKDYLFEHVPIQQLGSPAHWSHVKRLLQKNGYHCGLFLCYFSDCQSRKWQLDFDEEKMPTISKEILEMLTRESMGKESNSFLLQSPPGEFNEVFNDVRMLLNNDSLLEKGCAAAIADYNKDQFVPVKVEGAGAPTLITKFNELQDGRFVDPKSRKVFIYDHLRKDATDVQPVGAHDLEEKLEPWRKSIQLEVDDYIQEHFYGIGVATVFTAKNSVTLCIESHNFQPKNFWNGRWRSEWHLPVYDGKAKDHDCSGKIRLQVHYYEDGNVQLISQKDAKVDIKFSPDMAASAKELVRLICECESAYQSSIQENYALMSDTTFKALRRALPITRSKLDWIKLQSYRVAQDIKPQ